MIIPPITLPWERHNIRRAQNTIIPTHHKIFPLSGFNTFYHAQLHLMNTPTLERISTSKHSSMGKT